MVSLSKVHPQTKYLMELLAEDPIEAHFYSPSGPPSTAQRIQSPAGEIEGVQDWVVTATEGGRTEVIYQEAGQVHRKATQFHEPVLLHLNYCGDRATDLKEDEFTQHELDDARALLVAKAMKADLYLVPRPLSFKPQDPQWWTTTVMAPWDAIALVGLYLRHQGLFSLGRSPAFGLASESAHATRRERTWFYWQAARTLLPSEQLWRYTCESHSEDRGTTLRELPQSLTWRLDQVLRARDRVLSHLAVVPMKHDVVDDIVTDVDLILIFLMAAFDITARAVHLILNLSGGTYQAAWHKQGWLAKVARMSPKLAGIFDKTSKANALLEVLRLLRNTVHENPFSAGGGVHVIGPVALEPVVRIPPDLSERVLEAFDTLGGRDDWGAQRPFPKKDANYIHAGSFLERVVGTSLVHLEATVQAICSLGPYAQWESTPRTPLEERALWQLGVHLPST
jgi:hypothetical protein